jgi:rhamnosyltransferase subunit B
MDFLLATIGSHGDVHPYVGLGMRLRERGHRVRLITNGYFGPLVRAAGIDSIELGTAEEYIAIAQNPDMWHLRKAFKAVFGEVARLLPRLYDLIEQNLHDDTIVVSSSLCLGARVAEDKLGFPHATIHLSPAVLRSVHEPPKLPGFTMPRWVPHSWQRALWNVLDATMIDPFIAPPVNELRAKLGLAPVKQVLRDWWHAPRLTIGMWPSWFGPPPPDWPEQLRLTGFPLFDERGITPLNDRLIKFLDAGDPPVAFTPGSAMFRGQRFFKAAVDTCVRADVRGILLTRHGEHLPPALPDNVIHVDYAPFSELLPRLGALVHHGGIGTSAQAMACGTPQLVVTFTHDQPDNAHRMQRLGVARTLPIARFNGRRGARFLRGLLDSPQTRNRCREIARRFDGVDGLDDTCDLIETLAPCNPGGTGLQPLSGAARTG